MAVIAEVLETKSGRIAKKLALPSIYTFSLAF
jgi:hypothetical protein